MTKFLIYMHDFYFINILLFLINFKYLPDFYTITLTLLKIMYYSPEYTLELIADVYQSFFDSFISNAKTKNFKWNNVLPLLTIYNSKKDFLIFINTFKNKDALKYYNEYCEFKILLFTYISEIFNQHKHHYDMNPLEDYIYEPFKKYTYHNNTQLLSTNEVIEMFQ